jgi:DNA-binding MarR family transcriptional regulator
MLAHVTAADRPSRPGFEDDPRRAAWRLLVETHGHLIDELSDAMRAEHGFTLSTYDVLLQLDEAPGNRLGMRALTDAVAISKSGLSRLVDAMERDGLVTRCSVPNDRRAVDIELTEQGRARFQAAAATHVPRVRTLFVDHLTPEDGEALWAILAKLPSSRRSIERGAGREG